MNTVSFGLRLLFCLLCGLGSCFIKNPIQAAITPRISVLCDSTALIGDSLSLKLRYTTEKIGNVQLPILNSEFAANIDFFNTPPTTDTTQNDTNGLYTITTSYPFSIYTEGYHTIPPITFTVLTDTGPSYIASDSLFVRIIAPEIDTTKNIKDIKNIATVSFAERFIDFISRNYIVIICILFALVIIVLCTWFFIKKKHNSTSIIKDKEKKLSALDQALLDLKSLKEKKLWQQNMIKEYYTELTDILRIFISDQCNISAIEMTSDELIDEYERLSFYNKELSKNLRIILHTADLVKFAKSQPLANEHEQCFKLVHLFVTEIGKNEENHE